MTSQQREWYIKLMNQLALEIETGTNKDGRKMTASHILVKLLRLAQITSGFITLDANVDPETGDVKDPKKIEFTTPNPKLEELVEIIKETNEDEKLIVWSCFIPDIKQISARLEAEGIKFVTFTGSTSDEDRDKAVAAFNGKHARECKVFLGNPAAGSTGINLRGYEPDAPEDHGCNCTKVVYYAQNWSMVHRSQSEDRAHRRGTRVAVEYIDLCVLGTIDEEIRNRVVIKRTNADTIQDVREVMKRVLTAMPDQDDD
jgi:SNF2 family DNA or RNA helicase